MLYLIPSSKADSLELPEGTLYRFLSTRTDLHHDSQGKECHVFESPAVLADFEQVPPEQLPALGDTTVCTEPFTAYTSAHINARIKAAVDEITECSNRWPAKTAAKWKEKNDQPGAENFLSANGKPVKIDAPQGWR